MRFGEYMYDILVTIGHEILRGEPMGIIRFESQLILAIYAYAKVFLYHYLPVILIGMAIIYMIGSGVFGRARIHVRGGMIERAFGTIMRVITNIIFAWALLIYGAAIGQVDNADGEANARITYTRRVRTGPIWNVVHTFTRISLHFNMGRGLFRAFFWVLGFIPRLRDNSRTRSIIARLLTFGVIFWGAWMIPFDLMT